MYASQKVQVFSCLRKPETHFRQAQGHQRAGAYSGSINLIQNTISTLYEVESQKTVNTKTLKTDYLVFRRNQRDIYSQLSGELDCKRQKDRK